MKTTARPLHERRLIERSAAAAAATDELQIRSSVDGALDTQEKLRKRTKKKNLSIIFGYTEKR